VRLQGIVVGCAYHVRAHPRSSHVKRLVANPPSPGSFFEEILGPRFALPSWWTIAMPKIQNAERLVINVSPRVGRSEMQRCLAAFKSGRRWGKVATTRSLMEAEARRARAGSKREP
jgi:hypothetical protein